MVQVPSALEFLGLTGEVAERDLERALVDRIVEARHEFGPSFTSPWSMTRFVTSDAAAPDQ